MMRVSVLDAHGDDVQRHLHKEAGEHQAADDQRIDGLARLMPVVQLRQQMQQREAEEKRPGKRIDQLDMPGGVEPEKQDRAGAQEDA
jgi:hypothetical protein